MTRWTPDSQKRLLPLADSTGISEIGKASRRQPKSRYTEVYHPPLWLWNVDNLSTTYKEAKPLSHDLSEEDYWDHMAKIHPRHRSFNSGFTSQHLHHLDTITDALDRSCCPPPEETARRRTVSGQALAKRPEKALQRHTEDLHEIFRCHP